MNGAIAGGILFALGCLYLPALKSAVNCAPRPWWIRGNTLESFHVVLLVSMCALGVTLVVNAWAKTGATAFLIGAAIAAAGLVLAIVVGLRRRRAAAPASALTPAGMA